MRSNLQAYAASPEPLIVGLARTGNRDAFAELVRRRQSWIRNLMRRCCGDAVLADDLAQQVLVQAWRSIPKLKQPKRFGTWLKRLAINVWLKHVRVNDVLGMADEDIGEGSERHTPDVARDLDAALATLQPVVRLCVVLNYHEGMSHGDIAELLKSPLGTIKSHVRRGTQQLRKILSDYHKADAEQ